MAAINKVRIVGPRYKQQTRIYKDETFHFSSDEGPQNAIITARNTFGKGVLLQLLFQPMIPKTAWNRGKNKVNHFFYAEKSQYKPYTFYSCIDFHLAADSHLLVGIVMTSQLDDKKNSEPLYTLFMRQYGQSLYDPLSIENLPLYNPEKEAPVSYTEFAEFLGNHKKEFRTFYDHSKSKFYQALSEYGIMKKDWEQLIDINQFEGGVSQYFDDKNATTNQGLFSKMIIPAIEARLTEKGEENDLITLFKNIASITKNLPELKKNATAYIDIKNYNAEFLLKLDDYIQEKEKLDIHMNKGYSIIAALENEISILKEELKDHDEQLKEYRLLDENLRWKAQNLQYVVKHYEHAEISEELQSLENQKKDAAEKKQNLSLKVHNAELLVQLKNWQKKEQEHQEVLSKKSAIEQSNEYRESMEMRKDLEHQIHDEWEKARNKIQQIDRESESYKNHLIHLQKDIHHDMEEYREKLIEIGIAKGVIDNSINDFEEKLKKEQEHYGEYFYYDLEKLYEEKSLEFQKQSDCHSNLIHEQSKLSAELEGLGRDETKVETEISLLLESVNASKARWTAQERKEQNLLQKVWKVLRKDSEEVVDFRDWLETNLPLLKNRKKDNEIIYNQLSIQMYELEFEVRQSDEPFLIPNKDLYEVKTLLTDRGVPVIFGDEYIKQQEPAKREELNKNHPLLKYGLIIPGENNVYMEQIRKLDKQFYHSPVPVFSVAGLKILNDSSFMLLDYKASEMSIHDERLEERKQELNNKSKEIKGELSNLKDFIETLVNTAADLESFDRNITAEDLEKEYSNLKNEFTEKEKEKEAVKGKIAVKKEELENITNGVNDTAALIDELNKECGLLKRWIEYKTKYEAEKTRQREFTLSIQGFKRKQGLKKEELKKAIEAKDVWKEACDKWEGSIRLLIENVRKVIPKAKREVMQTENMQSNPPFLEADESTLNDYLYRWEQINKKAIESNAELIGLEVDLGYKEKAVNQQEEKLSKLEKEWKYYQVPREALPVLEKNFVNSNKELEDITGTLRDLGSELKFKNETQKKLKEEVDKLTHTIISEYGRKPEVWEKEDFNILNNVIREARKSNLKDIKETNEILEDIKANILKYESTSGTLKGILNTLNSIPNDITSSINIQERVKKEPEKVMNEWTDFYKNMNATLNQKKLTLNGKHREIKDQFEQSDWAFEIKDMALKVYGDIDFEELDEAKASIASLDLLARTEIADAEEEKNTAEEAKQEWVEHACKYALQIIEHLRKMVKAMRITNRNKIAFPLVKLKKEHLLPKETEQIRGNIEDLFDRVITELFAEFQDIKDVPQKLLKDKISVNNIILAAFNYQYPILRLYRLHEENSFLYEPPKEEFYTDWETINESSKTDPAGSGGQLFGARTLLLMMLISFKRRNESNSNWKLLITDNPFSVAVSDHIVDPILAIAEELKFQWIVVTPPELVKIELLQKFDMYYQLSARSINSGTDQVVSEVQYGFRNYKKSKSVMMEDVISLN